jgi:hypothetical protein
VRNIQLSSPHKYFAPNHKSHGQSGLFVEKSTYQLTYPAIQSSCGCVSTKLGYSGTGFARIERRGGSSAAKAKKQVGAQTAPGPTLVESPPRCIACASFVPVTSRPPVEFRLNGFDCLSGSIARCTTATKRSGRARLDLARNLDDNAAGLAVVRRVSSRYGLLVSTWAGAPEAEYRWKFRASSGIRAARAHGVQRQHLPP